MTPGGSPFFSLPCRHLFLDACGVDGTCYQDFSFGWPELRRDFPEPGWLVSSSAFPFHIDGEMGSWGDSYCRIGCFATVYIFKGFFISRRVCVTGGFFILLLNFLSCRSFICWLSQYWGGLSMDDFRSGGLNSDCFSFGVSFQWMELLFLWSRSL
jgi:hypothetical protein